jgi:predicted permease
MLVSIIRTIFLLILTGVFVNHARQTPARSRKQRSFWLAAGAFGLFAFLNILFLIGVNTYMLLIPVLTIGTILLTISIVLLYQAWRAGEMQEQMKQAREAIQEEQERRRSKAK